jgi:hypothetical protein
MTERVEKTTDQTEAGGINERVLLDEIERIVRMTNKAYGYQHLSTIGSTLRDQYPDFHPMCFGYKNLLGLIEAHPECFKIKMSRLACGLPLREFQYNLRKVQRNLRKAADFPA